MSNNRNVWLLLIHLFSNILSNASILLKHCIRQEGYQVTEKKSVPILTELAKLSKYI